MADRQMPGKTTEWHAMKMRKEAPPLEVPGVCLGALSAQCSDASPRPAGREIRLVAEAIAINAAAGMAVIRE